jgi:hypothetical protein
MNVRITLTEEMLGTKAANKDVFADYIASKAPDDDLRKQELDTAEHREEAGTTVFHVQDGHVGIWDYQIKGFFKDACGSLRNADGTKSKELKAYKTRIDGLIFVAPRFIPAVLPEGGGIGVCERSLRADTPMGPRVSLIRSETIPVGTTFDVQIKVLNHTLLPLVTEWLAYGAYRGLGQWRNSGKGRFSVEILPD